MSPTPHFSLSPHRLWLLRSSTCERRPHSSLSPGHNYLIHSWSICGCFHGLAAEGLNRNSFTSFVSFHVLCCSSGLWFRCKSTETKAELQLIHFIHAYRPTRRDKFACSPPKKTGIHLNWFLAAYGIKVKLLPHPVKHILLPDEVMLSDKPLIAAGNGFARMPLYSPQCSKSSLLFLGVSHHGIYGLITGVYQQSTALGYTEGVQSSLCRPLRALWGSGWTVHPMSPQMEVWTQVEWFHSNMDLDVFKEPQSFAALNIVVSVGWRLNKATCFHGIWGNPVRSWL